MDLVSDIGWWAAHVMVAATFGTVWAIQLGIHSDEEAIVPLVVAAFCWPVIAPLWAGVMIGRRIAGK